MSTHKHQHYVPRFLLESWHLPTSKKLLSFRWAHGALSHKSFSAKSVAKMEHIYSMRRATDAPDVSVERDFLGPFVDDPASRSYQTMLRGGVDVLTENEKIDWARFLVSLMLRVPVMMECMRVRGREIIEQGLEERPDEFLEIRGDAEEETLREWVDKYNPSVIDDLAVMTLPALVQSKLLNGVFLQSIWITREFKKSPYNLLISDNPLIYVGTFESKFIVGLPITPTRAFFAFNGRDVWEKILTRGDRGLVRDMNYSTVSQAERYVYATDLRQSAFVSKYLRKKA